MAAPSVSLRRLSQLWRIENRGLRIDSVEFFDPLNKPNFPQMAVVKTRPFCFFCYRLEPFANFFLAESPMELRQLRYFVAIVDHGSLSRAAGSVYRATSFNNSCSSEEELGATLLHRSAQGMQATDAGKIFTNMLWRF